MSSLIHHLQNRELIPSSAKWGKEMYDDEADQKN